MIRKARLKDAKAIAELNNGFAGAGLMLYRRQSHIAKSIRDYFVVDLDKKIVGCVSLHLYSEKLAEIKALAVDASMQKQGWGKKLVEKCIDEAVNLGIPKIFALTYAPGLFEKLGFTRVDKEQLPEKIWKECILCKKYEKCDEICVVRDLT